MMKKVLKCIYFFGGYDYKVVDKINTVSGHYGIKYMIPGLSLLIIFLTAGYGGWHFSESLIDSNQILMRIIGTLLFALFVFYIDFLILNSGRSVGIIISRVMLSLCLGSIVAILTTLSFFKSDIVAESIRYKAELISPIDIEYQRKNFVIDSTMNSWDNRIRAMRDSAIVEAQGGSKSGKAGFGRIHQEMRDNIRVDSLEFVKRKKELSEQKERLSTERENTISKIENSVSDKGFISQVNSLWRLMKEGVVSLYTIIFLIALIISDMIPVLAKISKDYSKEDDPYKKYIANISGLINIKSENYEIDYTNIELIREKNENEFNRFNEQIIQYMNYLYASERYKELIDYYRSKGLPAEIINKISEKIDTIK